MFKQSSFKHRLIAALLMLTISLLLSLSAVGSILAQAAPTVRTIPLTSLLYGAQLSPDGKTLAVFENGNVHEKNEPPAPAIHLFDLSSGKEITTLSGATDYAADMAFSPDSRRLISIHTNGVLYIWDVKSGKPTKQILLPILGNVRIRLVPDGKTVVILSGSQPSILLLLDTSTGYITRTLRVQFDTVAAFQKAFSGGISFLDYQLCAVDSSPDGKLIATASVSDEVTLWDIATGKTTTVHPVSEKKGLFETCAVSFAPDGKSLVYFDGASKKTRFWDIKSGKESAALDGGSLTFALSPDSKLIAWLERKSTSDVAKVHITAIDKPDAITDVELPKTPDTRERISSLVFTPDAKQLILSGATATDQKNAIFIIDLKPS